MTRTDGPILCFGELLLRLSPPGHGPLFREARLDANFGGAEANVAVALARLGIVSTRILLDTALALLNHLPLFALMLRLKDPARLPSSVRLAWTAPPDGDADGHEPLRAAHFELHSVPLGLGDIFAGYSDHLVGLTALPRLCLGVLTGAPIDPIDTIAQG